MPERQAVEMVLQPCLKVLLYLHEQVRGRRRQGEGGREGEGEGEGVTSDDMCQERDSRYGD